MKTFTSKKSTSTFLIVLTISLGLILVTGYIYYENQKEYLLNQSSIGLQATASFNETQISNWYKERLSDARFLLNDDFIHNGIQKLALNIKKIDSIQLSNVILPMYTNHDYNTIFVLDRKLKLILNLNNDFIPDQNELNNAARAFSSKQIQNSQINKNQLSNKIYFDFYVPIYEDNKPLAVIVLSVAPEKLLYSFFEGNHFVSETGESIIFEKEDNAIINLSKLRNKNIPPLGLKIPIEKGDWTASVSSKILNKIELLKDYRGKEVLADIRYLKLMNWYLVTKIDLDEVYQSLKFKVIASSVIIFLIIGLTGLSFVFYNDKLFLKHLKRLNESESKNKQIIENASEGIVIFNKNLNIIQVNPVVCRDLGFTEKELLQKKVPSLLDPSDLHKHPLKMQELISGETILSERYLLRKDQSVYLADISAKMLPDETFLIIAKDITKRHETEVNIKSSEKKFRSLFESSNDGILLMDDMTIIDCNPKAEQIFGKTKSEIIGNTPVDFSPKNQPDGTSSETGANKKINEVYKGKPQLFEWVHLNSGKETFCEINLSLSELNTKPILIAIVRDISERKRIENELIQAKERAEEMNRLKSNFLANMSHELRTPMVGILGFAQILKDEITDVEQLQMIKSINRGGKRLMETLNSILELTQIESKEHTINYRLLNLNDLIKSKIINFKPEAENKNINLLFKEPKEEIKIVTDERLLKIVLRHLISNAVKFTEHGSVAIELVKAVADDEDKIIILIKDTGIGISAESRDLIFNEFRQASEGFNRKYEGSGLGLTITKKFIKLLGGNLEFESTVGKGSIFKVILPEKSEIPEMHFENEPTERVLSKKIIHSEVGENLKALPKILIVEDDPNTVSLLKIYLKNSGVFDIAQNAKQALEKTEQNEYDLILMDINLGEEIDGLMLTKMLRETKEFENTPIIAVTAFAMEKDRKNAFDAGCTNYLSKPFDQNTLLKMISDELYHSVYPTNKL